MFKNTFSFEGRIRRTEYCISVLIYAVVFVIIELIVETGGSNPIVFIGYIPVLWFLWAQGAKRCHDRGNSGWYQIIPFYGLWMMFGEGESSANEYGVNPKELENTARSSNS